MESRMPSIVDLSAELAKLTMFQRTPQSTRRRQREASHDWLPTAMASFWPSSPRGQIIGNAISPATSWSTSSTAPRPWKSCAMTGRPSLLRFAPGMIAVIPQGAWHRGHSSEGTTQINATPFPGEHVELDVDDPRTVERKPRREMESRTPSIIDLDAELAKLTMFRGRTPQSTMADRKGSGARLAAYRDGVLFATKFAGKGHWERHPTGDELIHVLDGTGTLEIVGEDGSQFFALRAGMIAVNPQGAWHRFHSSEGVTVMFATPNPSEHIELDVDDPRTVGRKPA